MASSERLAHRVGGLSAHAGEHVRVRVEGDRHPSVSEEFLDELRVYVALEEEGGACVEGVSGSIPLPPTF